MRPRSSGALYLCERHQHAPHGVYLVVRDAIAKLLVDGIDPLRYGLDDLVPAVGEGERDTAPVVGIGGRSR